MSLDNTWAPVEEGLCSCLWKLLCPKKSSGLDSAWSCDLGKSSEHSQPVSPTAKWIVMFTSQGGCETQTRWCSGRFLHFAVI